jgi:hypothetical protein
VRNASVNAAAQDETTTVTSQTIRHGPTEAVELAYAIIQFKEIAVPSIGAIESIVGSVDRFTARGWVPLHIGDVLENGAPLST